MESIPENNPAPAEPTVIPSDIEPQKVLNLSEIQYGGTATRADTLILTILIGAVLAMALVIGVGYFFFMKPGEPSPERTQAAVAETSHTPEDEPVESFIRNENAFMGVGLKARSAAVYDINSQELIYEQGAEDEEPLASLTKLMTALIAAETLAEDALVTVSPASMQSPGESGFQVHEKWNVRDLIGFTLMTSSNDGAQALAAAAGAEISNATLTGQKDESMHRLSFVQTMNKKSRELGLEMTYYVNATGLDEGLTAGGAYGSALDTAKLLAYIMRTDPDILAHSRLDKETFTSESGISHNVRNTNQRVGHIPGIIASKTGFTDLAGGNLAVIFDVSMNHPVAVVVLGSTFEDRFTDVEQLVAAARNYFTGGGQ